MLISMAGYRPPAPLRARSAPGMGDAARTPAPAAETLTAPRRAASRDVSTTGIPRAARCSGSRLPRGVPRSARRRRPLPPPGSTRGSPACRSPRLRRRSSPSRHAPPPRPPKAGGRACAAAARTTPQHAPPPNLAPPTFHTAGTSSERWTDSAPQSCRTAARSPPASRLRYATKREGPAGKHPATGTGAGAGAGTLMSLLVDGARRLPFLEHSPGTVVVHVTPSPTDPPQRLGGVPYANSTRPARPSRLPRARRSRCTARGTAPPRSWARSPRPRSPPRVSRRPSRSRCGVAPPRAPATPVRAHCAGRALSCRS